LKYLGILDEKIDLDWNKKSTTKKEDEDFIWKINT